jgi:hypothetical protein
MMGMALTRSKETDTTSIYADNTRTVCYTDTSYDFNLCNDSLNPLPFDFKNRVLKMPVMGSMKNLSPTRLATRRKKAASARKARKRNRK